jgi:hypothetical protein
MVMPSRTRQPESSSSLGPFLVLVTGVVFTGFMVYTLVQDLRFVLAGIPVQAKFAGDESGTIELRYLRGEPSAVRLEDDVHPAWRWRALWVIVGLSWTWFGVLLTWGRRPIRRAAWGRGRPGEQGLN